MPLHAVPDPAQGAGCAPVLYRTGHPVLPPQPRHCPPPGALPRFLQAAAEARLDAAFNEALLTSSGQWVEAGKPLEIGRFTPGEDLLSLAFDAAQPAPELTIKPGEDRATSLLCVNGKPLAVVHCQGLSLEDVVIMSEPPAGPALSAPENRLSASPERRAALP